MMVNVLLKVNAHKAQDKISPPLPKPKSATEMTVLQDLTNGGISKVNAWPPAQLLPEPTPMRLTVKDASKIPVTLSQFYKTMVNVKNVVTISRLRPAISSVKPQNSHAQEIVNIWVP